MNTAGPLLEALSRPFAFPGTRLEAPNRIAYQPMEGNDAEPDGSPGELAFRRYRARAAGWPGLELTEAVALNSAAKARPRQLVLAPATADAFARLVRAYREVNPRTPLLWQLTHSGRFALEPVSPFPIPGARLLDDDALKRIGDDLATAARLAAATGADGVDFKLCHGYLFGALLAPANRARPGWSYGGESLEQRARFLQESLPRLRAELPAGRFLIATRISVYEGLAGGFGSIGPESAEEDRRYRDLAALCRLLEAGGVDLLNQSAGVPELTPDLVRQTPAAPLGFFEHRRWAEALRSRSRLPLIGSGFSYLRDGKNRLPGDDPEAKSLLALGGEAVHSGRLDFIGVGRQSFADPGFAAKLLAGRFDAIRWDIACNLCARALRSGRPAGCAVHDADYRGA